MSESARERLTSGNDNCIPSSSFPESSVKHNRITFNDSVITWLGFISLLTANSLLRSFRRFPIATVSIQICLNILLCATQRSRTLWCLTGTRAQWTCKQTLRRGTQRLRYFADFPLGFTIFEHLQSTTEQYHFRYTVCLLNRGVALRNSTETLVA